MPYKTGAWGEQAKARYKKSDRKLYFREYRKRRDPIKIKARAAVLNALRRGVVVKLPCEHCGKTDGKIEAHHIDYTKPLAIIWLCPFHHREEEGKLRLLKKERPCVCLNCKKQIFWPKIKYCSSYCNLKGWKKGF